MEKREDVRNRIQYTGQQYDQETGQYYLRARYYNPVVGRFLQEDTYRGDGLNLYAYCANNPVVYYDPSGHMPQYAEGGVQGSGDTLAGQVNNGDDIPTNRISDNASIIGHIFKDTDGHILDTPENRSLLEEVANNMDNYRGNDQYDNAWYSKILDGKGEEDDLPWFLGAICPELWDDGKPIDEAIFNEWQKFSDCKTIDINNIMEKVYLFGSSGVMVGKKIPTTPAFMLTKRI